MESNKVKSIKARDIAESKIAENDFLGAKKFVNKAQNLYPKLDGLKQVSMMIDVYISASNKINGKGEADWYGVLGVDPLANDEALKKQYKKLALLLHPDKNKFTGATEAFKLVSEAWCLLSDKAKRIAYDRKRKANLFKHKKSGMQQKPPKPKHESDSEHKPEAGFPWKYEEVGAFWTKCDKCDTYCEFGRYSYLNKTITCPNCSQDFVATEIVLEMINGRPVMRFSKRRTDTSYSSTSASDSAKAAEERMRRWFEPDPEPKHEHEPDSSSAKEKDSGTAFFRFDLLKTCGFTMLQIKEYNGRYLSLI